MSIPPFSPDPCMCSHGRARHNRDAGGKLSCRAPLCGCGSFRPRPSPADEAETWLAGREPHGMTFPETGGIT